jgi:hypothetical protein
MGDNYMTAAKLQLPAGQTHGRHAYTKHKCRCDICRAANTKHCYKTNKARREKRAVLLLHCDDCPLTIATTGALELHIHTMSVHGRRITDQERTPRT